MLIGQSRILCVVKPFIHSNIYRACSDSIGKASQRSDIIMNHQSCHDVNAKQFFFRNVYDDSDIVYKPNKLARAVEKC